MANTVRHELKIAEGSDMSLIDLLTENDLYGDRNVYLYNRDFKPEGRYLSSVLDMSSLDKDIVYRGTNENFEVKNLRMDSETEEHFIERHKAKGLSFDRMEGDWYVFSAPWDDKIYESIAYQNVRFDGDTLVWYKNWTYNDVPACALSKRFPEITFEYEEFLEGKSIKHVLMKNNQDILDFHSDKMIDALVAAGEWHIDEEAFKLFQTAKDPENVDFVCSVYYGNHVFDFVGREALNEGFYLDYEQYVPIEAVDDALHTHTDGQLDKKEFRFEITPGELELAFYNEQSDIGTFARTDENKVSIEAFKKSIVEKLLSDKMLAMKPDEYKFMHDNGICYHQQFHKQRDEFLSKIAKQDKLSPDELINLARFYYNDSYASKDMSARIEKIVDKMDQAGFPETKKNILFGSMAKLIDDPVNREVFRNTIKMYSGLKKKAEAKVSLYIKH